LAPEASASAAAIALIVSSCALVSVHLRLAGAPSPVAEGVWFWPPPHAATISVTANERHPPMEGILTDVNRMLQSRS